jgi:ferredoxin
MARYKVEFDRKGCIGAETCAIIHEKGYKMNKDGKADLLGGAPNGQEGHFELVVEEPDLPLHKQAAEGCPAEVIRITNLETGEKVF